MAAVECRHSWRVEADREAILVQLTRYLERTRMDYEQSDGEGGVVVLEACGGSGWKTRLLGGWWVPARLLPRRAVLEVEPAVSGYRVWASLEEALGYGWLDPVLKGKYERAFGAWLDGLEGALGPQVSSHRKVRAELPNGRE